MSEETSATVMAHDRLIQDNQRAMDRVFEELGRVNASIGQVRERMAALEASSLQPQVSEVRAEVGSIRERVVLLEAHHVARGEVGKATDKQIEWVYRLAPWAFFVAYVIYNAVRHGGI